MAKTKRSKALKTYTTKRANGGARKKRKQKR